MQTEFSVNSRSNIMQLNTDIKSHLDTIIQLIKTIKSLNDITISSNEKEWLADFLNKELDEKILNLKKLTDEKKKDFP
jgi:hypothetical protein